MKKLIGVILAVITVFMLASCTKTNYEENFLGNWINDYEDTSESMMYFFEKDEEGNYTASCIFGASAGSRPEVYAFERFSASKSELTLYGNGKELSYDYSFENGKLYLHNMVFEKTE